MLLNFQKIKKKFFLEKKFDYKNESLIYLMS